MRSSGSTRRAPSRRSGRSTPGLACPTPIHSGCSAMLRGVGYVLAKLDWMRAERIWPNGVRYLWTDAFGVVLYVSLYRELGEVRWLNAAECLVAEVERVLGRPRGLRIGEAPDRDGQYFHYLALWLFAQDPRPVAVFVPGHRQARKPSRLPAHGQARSRRGQALLPQDAAG